MSLRSKLESMSPREQKLLSALGIVVLAFIFLGIPAYGYGELWGAREHNEDIRQLLGRMDKASELLAKRKRERQARALLYAKPAPALASFIESMAQAYGIQVPESTDRPDVVGKGFTERVTVVKMRKVNLMPLVKMLEKIERSGHPVAVTMLTIKARATVPDEYDVQLGVSAYDKKGATSKAAGASSDQPKPPPTSKTTPEIKVTPKVNAGSRGRPSGASKARPRLNPTKGQEL
jgi:general secretion pathway protein M